MIKWVEDLGAPGVVAVADIATSELKPTWNRPLGIGLAALGYIAGGVLGMGGAFLKNVGIAAAPWAFESIYLYIKESTGEDGAAARVARARQTAVNPGARVKVNPRSQITGANRSASGVGAFVEEQEILT
jgi:hypothetical protein